MHRNDKNSLFNFFSLWKKDLTQGSALYNRFGAINLLRGIWWAPFQYISKLKNRSLPWISINTRQHNMESSYCRWFLGKNMSVCFKYTVAASICIVECKETKCRTLILLYTEVCNQCNLYYRKNTLYCFLALCMQRFKNVWVKKMNQVGKIDIFTELPHFEGAAINK